MMRGTVDTHAHVIDLRPVPLLAGSTALRRCGALLRSECRIDYGPEWRHPRAWISGTAERVRGLGTTPRRLFGFGDR